MKILKNIYKWFIGIFTEPVLNYEAANSIAKFGIILDDKSKLKNAIQSSNEKFNQYYEIETDNPDLLNKYCTNSMLACFVELAKKNINLEVNIFQNKICIRLHDKDFLDFNIKSELDEEKYMNQENQAHPATSPIADSDTGEYNDIRRKDVV